MLQVRAGAKERYHGDRSEKRSMTTTSKCTMFFILQLRLIHRVPLSLPSYQRFVRLVLSCANKNTATCQHYVIFD